jgi:hypothetical protein
MTDQMSSQESSPSAGTSEEASSSSTDQLNRHGGPDAAQQQPQGPVPGHAQAAPPQASAGAGHHSSAARADGAAETIVRDGRQGGAATELLQPPAGRREAPFVNNDGHDSIPADSSLALEMSEAAPVVGLQSVDTTVTAGREDGRLAPGGSHAALGGHSGGVPDSASAVSPGRHAAASPVPRQNATVPAAAPHGSVLLPPASAAPPSPFTQEFQSRLGSLTPVPAPSTWPFPPAVAGGYEADDEQANEEEADSGSHVAEAGDEGVEAEARAEEGSSSSSIDAGVGTRRKQPEPRRAEDDEEEAAPAAADGAAPKRRKTDDEAPKEHEDEEGKGRAASPKRQKKLALAGAGESSTLSPRSLMNRLAPASSSSSSSSAAATSTTPSWNVASLMQQLQRTRKDQAAQQEREARLAAMLQAAINDRAGPATIESARRQLDAEQNSIYNARVLAQMVEGLQEALNRELFNHSAGGGAEKSKE